MLDIGVREARLGDAAGIAKVHVDSWRTTYPGIMPDAVLSVLSYEEREQLWTRRLSAAAESKQVVFVAEQRRAAAHGQDALAADHEEAAGIVGFASGGPAGRSTP